MSPLEKDRSEGNVVLASWKNSAEMIEAPKLEVLRACWIKVKFPSSYFCTTEMVKIGLDLRSGRGPISRGGSQAKCFAVGF